jgi:hypothetical protein
MAEHLNINIVNEIGSLVSRENMIRAIVIKSNDFTVKKCETCSKLGMVQLPKTPNKYTYSNVGGKLIQTLEFNSNSVQIDLDKPLFDIANNDIIQIIPKLDKRFYVKPIKTKEGKQSKKQVMLTKIIEDISKKDRRTIAAKHIENPKQFWDNWGKFDNFQNSSSLDSLFMLFFVSNLSNLFTSLFTTKKNTLEFYKTLSTTQEPKNIENAIKALEEEINSLRAKILGKNIINLSHFRLKLRGLFGKIKLLNKPYYNPTMYQPVLFINDLFRVFGVDNQPYSIMNRYFIEKDSPADYSGSNGNLYRIPIVENVLDEQTKTNISDNIVFKIDGPLLKYLNTRNIYISDLGRNLDELLYCPKCNEFLGRESFARHTKNFHKKNIVELQECLQVQIDMDFSESPVWVVKNGWDTRMIGSQNIFYKIGREKDARSYLSEGTVLMMDPPIAKKYERIVDKLTITDSNLIIFDVDRTQGRYNKNTLVWEGDYYEELSFLPNEIIEDINGNKYGLQAIITNRNSLCVLFMKSNDVWLSYNSHFNIETGSDYITNIGNYTSLLDYKGNYVQHFGNLYFYYKL